jgi:hypothetical protein
MGEELRLYGEVITPGAVPARTVTDEDRERAIGWLRHHCGVGTLSLDEFGDRALEVYRSTSETELWQALDGLGIEHAAAVHVPRPTVTPEAARRPGRRWHVAIFGGADRRGRWRIASHSLALALFGGVNLDLRSVSLEDPDINEITMTAVAIFGGIDIAVPDGMEVDVEGLAIFGGKDVRVADVPINRGLPMLRVRAVVLFGGLDVRTKKDRPRRRG